jgi:hypothetical protein
MNKPICLWSGPRNVSTALMYSFAQRADVRVVDEPLYGHYLRVSGAMHPGRDQVIAQMNCDGNAVIAELMRLAQQHAGQHYFLKHMAHHLVELDLDFLDRTRNVLLIRDPREMLPSLTIQVPHATLADTGLHRQWQLYADLVGRGQRPVVLDSRELLLDPAGVLREFCERIGLDYSDNMLHWPAGPLPEDGVWAAHWYQAVHASTGYAPYRAKAGFPGRLDTLLAECLPWYDKLYAQAIRATNDGE